MVENVSTITCISWSEKIFGPSQALHSTAQLGVPLLGRLPLDPERVRWCDADEMDGYTLNAFEPIAKRIMEHASALKEGQPA